MVPNFDAKTWSDLVLPLAWHNFSIGSRNFDSCIKASLVVSISHVPSKTAVASNRAVIWSLVSWESMRRPSKRSCFELVLSRQNSVLLLDSIPRLFIGSSIENWLSEGSEVSVGRDEILVVGVLPCEGLAQHEDVVSLSERIREKCDWFDDYFRVFCCCLVARRPIKIPFRKL